jgi:hypothetical protein
LATDSAIASVAKVTTAAVRAWRTGVATDVFGAGPTVEPLALAFEPTQPVPEPAEFTLSGIGLLGLIAVRLCNA